MHTETRIDFNIGIRAYTNKSLRSDECRELPTAGKLEVLSSSLFVGLNVEIALECTHVGKRLCPMT